MSKKPNLPTMLYSLPLQSTLMDTASIDTLRQQYMSGDLNQIEFDARVYHHRPNRNHLSFYAEDLPDFAASYKGQPFLRNHDTRDIGARDGTILESHLQGDAFYQRIRLTTERGIKSFLEGQIDRFSIGWYHDGINCGVCGGDWFGCDHWPGRHYTRRRQDGQNETLLCELLFVNPKGKEVSAVNAPAVDGTGILAQLCEYKEQHQMSSKYTIVLPDGTTHHVPPNNSGNTPVLAEPVNTQNPVHPVNPVDTHANAWLDTIRQQAIDNALANSGLSSEAQEAIRWSIGKRTVTPEELAEQIEQHRKLEAKLLEKATVQGVKPTQTVTGMQTSFDKLQAGMDWALGVPGAETPPPNLRNFRDMYLYITGDYNFHGVFDPDMAMLATATTSTMAGMAVNALNKAVFMHFDNMATYRWYERIVSVLPHDNTTHSVQLIYVDGLANLPTVSEGAAYQEATAGDSKESMSFTKRGQYVGITLEMIRRSDIARIQAIPRELVKASVRARSATISAFFTQASGTGPTLADDSLALFHVTHGNLGTAALSATEWAAARRRIWEQSVPGTSKPLAMWPRFCLVPIELYDTALVLFGYGAGPGGYPNTANNDVNPYAQSRAMDPRPEVIPVPDWTDANDWAQIVDPALHPVLCMAYANAPQGNSHPMPEVFQVSSETQGLMFSNDTLPVKARDWYAAGVATYVGIGKNNVT